jgi:DNA-binding XRE family transcriptional regulator
MVDIKADSCHNALRMWNPGQIRQLRERLTMDQSAFAKLVGVDGRTVARWESNRAQPTGAAEAVMNGLRETLDSDPADEAGIIKFIVATAAVGGLAYLLVKLLTKRNSG